MDPAARHSASERFDSFLAQVDDADSREIIKGALLAKRIKSVTYLKQAVEGQRRGGGDAIGLLQRTLSLNELDASVLVGLLLEPQGKIHVCFSNL